MSSSISQRSTIALFWAYGGLAINFICQISSIPILARILSPEVYGQFAIVTICYTAIELLIATGLGPAVIQRNSDNPIYLQTAWTTRFSLCIGLGGTLFLTAKIWTESVFSEPLATHPLKIVSAAIIVSALSNPQLLTLQRNLNLKALTTIDCLSTVARYATAISIGIYYENVYALAFGYAAFLVTQTIASYCFLPSLPNFHFSLLILKKLFRFSMWLQLQNILNWASRSIAPSLISKQLGVSALGYFNRAQTIASLPEYQLKTVINKIAFPAFCKIQNDPVLLGRGHAKLVDLLLLSFVPLLILFYANSKFIINIIMGPGWEKTADLSTLLLAAILFRSLNQSVIPIIRATGGSRPEFFLILFRAIGVALFLIFFLPRFGLAGAAIALLAAEAALFPIALLKAQQRFPIAFAAIAKSTLSAALAATCALLAYGLLPERHKPLYQFYQDTVVQTLVFGIVIALLGKAFAQGPWVTFSEVVKQLRSRKALPAQP